MSCERRTREVRSEGEVCCNDGVVGKDDDRDDGVNDRVGDDAADEEGGADAERGEEVHERREDDVGEVEEEDRAEVGGRTILGLLPDRTDFFRLLPKDRRNKFSILIY